MNSINNKTSTGMSVKATAKPKINRAAKSGLGLKGHAKVTIHRPAKHTQHLSLIHI